MDNRKKTLLISPSLISPVQVRIFTCCVFFLSLAVIGAYIVLFAVHSYGMARISVSWPEQAAIITDDGEEGWVSMKETGYIYNIEGQNYRGNKTRFFVNNRLFSGARKQQFSAGDRIKVFTNPDDVSMSVVLPGATRTGFIILLSVGVLIFFLGFGAGISALFLSRNNAINGKSIK